MIYLVDYNFQFGDGIEDFVGTYYTADTTLDDATHEFMEELEHYFDSNEINPVDYFDAKNMRERRLQHTVHFREMIPPMIRPEWDEVYFKHTGRHLYEEDHSAAKLEQSYIELEKKVFSSDYDCRIESMLFVLSIVHYLDIWDDFSFIAIEQHVIQSYNENIYCIRTFRDYICNKNEFKNISEGSTVMIKNNEAHGEYVVEQIECDPPCMDVPHWENFRFICKTDDAVCISHHALKEIKKEE